MKNPGFTCDTCMRLGSGDDLNRWWIIAESCDGGIARFAISPFVAQYASTKGSKHACSKRCADALIHNFLRTAKNDKKAFDKFIKDTYHRFQPLFSFGEDDD